MLIKSNFDPWEVAYAKLFNRPDELFWFSSFGPIEKLSTDCLLKVDPILLDDFLIQPRLNWIF